MQREFWFEFKGTNAEKIQTGIYLKYTSYLLAVGNTIYWVICKDEFQFEELNTLLHDVTACTIWIPDTHCNIDVRKRCASIQQSCYRFAGVQEVDLIIDSEYNIYYCLK